MNGADGYSWEALPEYRWAQRYGYSVGRVLASVPPRWRARCTDLLGRAAALISTGIALANAEPGPGDAAVPDGERLQMLELGLDMLAMSRDLLRKLRRLPDASAADIMVALELLERVESGMQRQAAGLRKGKGLRLGGRS
jgi:hypothetical protein